MGVSFGVSRHAVEQYIARINGALTVPEARAAIRGHGPAIEAALEFGCKCVRLPCGGRLILDLVEQVVVTVYPPQPKVKGRRYHGRRHAGRGAVSMRPHEKGAWNNGEV